MEWELRITIEDIFQTVCDLPLEQRSAYLDKACAGDQMLRREVEALLKYYDTRDSFLENRALDDAANQIATAPSAPATTQAMIGRTVERYRILALLGKGGMGEVYLARDTELDIDVAIKFLPAAYADDPEWQARFKREARLIAAAKHENITEIHHTGAIDGRPFLVFEYVPGDTLEDKLERGPLPIKEALPLFIQIAAALECAHARGIIHRDLKPANIKITPTGTVKVLDFGIAKKISADPSTIDPTATLAANKAISQADYETRDFGATRKGEVIGTIAYMSPEQTWGERLDHRTDLWSFGCVLYEVLAGRRPFKGLDTYDTLKAIRQSEPDWQTFSSEVPARIRGLLRQCLAKKPAARLKSAGEAKQIIDEVLRQVIFTRRLKKQLAVTLTVLLLATGAYAAWRNWRPSIPTLVVMAAQADAPCQTMGNGLATALNEKLQDIPGIKIIPSSAIPARLTGASPSEIASYLDADLILQSNVQCAEARRYKLTYSLVDNKGVQTASANFEEQSNYPAIAQEQLAGALNSNLKIEIKKQLDKLSGRVFDSQANYEQALLYLQSYGRDAQSSQPDEREATYLDRYDHEPAIDAAIALLEQVISKPSGNLNFAEVWAKLSQAYLHKFYITYDRTYREKARKAYDRATEFNSELPDVQLTAGKILLDLRRYEDAIGAFSKVLEKRANDRDAMLGLARAYEYNDNLSEAERRYNELVSQHPNFWDAHNQLAAYYFEQNKLDLAIKAWVKLTEVAPASFVGFWNLGTVYYYQGRVVEAIEMYREALKREKTARIYLDLGTALFFQGKYDEAYDQFQNARELNSRMPQVWGYLGDACGRLANCPINVTEAYDEAILLASKILGADSNNTYLRSLLSEWQAKRGEMEKAKENIGLALSRRDCDASCLVSGVIVYQFASSQAKELGNRRDYLWQRAKALELIRRALSNGYPVSELQTTPELGELSSDPEFQSIIKFYQKKP